MTTFSSAIYNHKENMEQRIWEQDPVNDGVQIMGLHTWGKIPQLPRFYMHMKNMQSFDFNIQQLYKN